MGDYFDGSFVAQVTEGASNLGKKKFKDLSKAKEWAKRHGRKHGSGGKFTVTIVKDYYHTVYSKNMR